MAEKGGHWVKSAGGGMSFVAAGGGASGGVRRSQKSGTSWEDAPASLSLRVRRGQIIVPTTVGRDMTEFASEFVRRQGGDLVVKLRTGSNAGNEFILPGYKRARVVGAKELRTPEWQRVLGS